MTGQPLPIQCKTKTLLNIHPFISIWYSFIPFWALHIPCLSLLVPFSICFVLEFHHRVEFWERFCDHSCEKLRLILHLLRRRDVCYIDPSPSLDNGFLGSFVVFMTLCSSIIPSFSIYLSVFTSLKLSVMSVVGLPACISPRRPIYLFNCLAYKSYYAM